MITKRYTLLYVIGRHKIKNYVLLTRSEGREIRLGCQKPTVLKKLEIMATGNSAGGFLCYTRTIKNMR